MSAKATMQSGSSLIKYETARLISKTTGERKVARDKKAATSTTSPRRSAVARTGTSGDDGVSAPVQKHQTEEILNVLIRPREWTEDGSLWVQPVSSIPAMRREVMSLKEAFDAKLRQFKARETGICSVRRKLYQEMFDELIRQVTIECMQRGVLLSRVRDELSMTLAAYQTLYESK